MLNCIKDKNFVSYSYSDKRNRVLTELESLIDNSLSNIGIRLFTPISLVEKVRLLYKETKNDYFVSTLTKEIFVAMELMQNKEININNKSLDVIETSFKYSKYQVNRIGLYPLFTYDVDGNITKIELTNRTTRINVLCSLISTITDRQIEIKKSLNKTL